MKEEREDKLTGVRGLKGCGTYLYTFMDTTLGIAQPVRAHTHMTLGGARRCVRSTHTASIPR